VYNSTIGGGIINIIYVLFVLYYTEQLEHISIPTIQQF